MVVLLKSLKPTWFNLLSNYYASDCSTFTLVIHLFSDLLAVLNIPHIHEMCFRVGLFSLIVLGTQSALQSVKSCPSDMGNFLDFFLRWFLLFYFSETPFIWILELLCPLMLFSLFFISLSIYSTFWRCLQLYPSTLILKFNLYYF